MDVVIPAGYWGGDVHVANIGNNWNGDVHVVDIVTPVVILVRKRMEKIKGRSHE